VQKQYYSLLTKFFFFTTLVLIGLYLYHFSRVFFIDEYMPSRADPIWYYLDTKAFFENSSILSPYIQDESVSKIGEAGAHGPGYAIFYGLIAKVFGFNDQLILWVNFFLLGTLVFLILRFNRFDKLSKYILITIQLSYFTTLWNCFAFTPEIIHIFLANIIAFHLIEISKGLEETKVVSKKDFFLLGLIIVLAGFFRYSWVLSILGIFAFTKKKNDFWYFTSICIFILGLGMIYLKLFHATYYGLVLGNCSEFIKQGNLPACVNSVYNNVAMNMPMFFYKYYYSNYYFLTKLVFVVSLICLISIFYKTKSRLIFAVVCIQLIYFLSLFLFYDAYDTRDIRGLTPSLIIALITLAYHKKYFLISLFALSFLLVFPSNYKDFKYKIYDLSLESGRIHKKFDLDILKRLQAKNSNVITVLIPEQFYWAAMPNRNPITIKDILHTKSLALPLKNYQGVPIRYTVNTAAFPPYHLHNKIKVDYVIDLNSGRILSI
jgi:hypothetical protein